MPKFKFTDGVGNSYIVTAPDEETAISAFKTQVPAPKSTGEDVASQFGSGLVDLATQFAGTGGDIRELMASGVEYALGKLGGGEGAKTAADSIRAIPIGGPTSAQARSAVESVIGELPEAQTRAGEITRRVTPFAAGLVTPGGLATKAIQTVAPAVISEGGRELARRGGFNETGQDIAGIAGAILGGGLPGFTRRAITPNPAKSETVNAVKYLRSEGVETLSAGQKAGKLKLKKSEAVLAGTDFFEASERQFTGAVLKRIGVDAQRVSPEILENARKRIGRAFENIRVAPNAGIFPSQSSRIKNAIDLLTDVASDVPVPRTIRLAEQYAGRGTISGRQYKDIRSRLSKISSKAPNPAVREAARSIIDALDDSMNAALRSSGNERLVREYAKARQEWRNLLVVRKAARGGSAENVADGIITPAQLRSAIESVEGVDSFTHGRGPFSALARAGIKILTRPKSSGTPEGILASGATSLGSIPGRLIGRAKVSGPGQAYLGNQLLRRSRGLTAPRGALLGGASSMFGVGGS